MIQSEILHPVAPSLGNLTAQRIRTLALALLNLHQIDSHRVYQVHDLLIMQSHSGILLVQYHGQIVLRSDRCAIAAAQYLMDSTLAMLEAIYLQAEVLDWQRSTGEDPAPDWECQWQIRRIQAEETAAIVRRLPLQTLVHPYQIRRNHLGLVLTRGEDDLVLIDRDDCVWNYSMTQADWEFFQWLDMRS
jgi:hypothetical protein